MAEARKYFKERDFTGMPINFSATVPTSRFPVMSNWTMVWKLAQVVGFTALVVVDIYLWMLLAHITRS